MWVRVDLTRRGISATLQLVLKRIPAEIRRAAVFIPTFMPPWYFKRDMHMLILNQVFRSAQRN